MRLLELLDKVDYKCIQGSVDAEVSAVIYDSRKRIMPGCLLDRKSVV